MRKIWISAKCLAMADHLQETLWCWLYPVCGTPGLYIDVGQTRTPIKDIQRERGTSLEHIMVGMEYGMAPEMTHGPAAGCAFCTEDSTTTTERERERGGYRSATEYARRVEGERKKGRKSEKVKEETEGGRSVSSLPQAVGARAQ